MAKDTGIPLMASVARMVAKRLYGILNAMKNRVSNGNAESLNSKIRLLRIKFTSMANTLNNLINTRLPHWLQAVITSGKNQLKPTSDILNFKQEFFYLLG